MESPGTKTVRWRIHLNVPPVEVHRFLATEEGRSRFWAESAEERAGAIHFRFVNGQTWRGAVVDNAPPRRFAVRYFGESIATFDLADDGRGGTDLALTETGVPAEWWAENHAGWVSVLLALKAAAEFGVDLRNHDSTRTWDQGFADN